MKTITCMFAAGMGLAAATVGVAIAQGASRPPLKPGLWEVVRQKAELDGKPLPDMEEQLKNMPPAMREHLQEMMRQKGVELGAGARSLRVCLDEQSLAGNGWVAHRAGCQTDVTQRSSAGWKWHSTCTQPPSTTDAQTRFDGTDSYTSDLKTVMQRGDKTQVMTMTMVGKWLGAACGDVKPIR